MGKTELLVKDRKTGETWTIKFMGSVSKKLAKQICRINGTKLLKVTWSITDEK